MPTAAIPTAPATQSEFETKLDRLAQIAVRIGLGLGEPGAPQQELVMSASIDALPLVRRITEHAYRAGAVLVTTLYSDEQSALLRFQHAPDASFDTVATWLQDGIANAYRSGAARLAIAGGDPALLAGQDAGKVGRANAAMSRASKPAIELITKHAINWTIVAAATPAWARAVFPMDDEATAVARLWEAIFAASRANVDDPVAAWKAHGERLKQRVDFLNDRRYSALHYNGPGTDLRVGLADDHLWAGGGTRAGNGIYCQPNIPTEEVFTTPHKDRVDGTVRSSKPLSYQGTLIEGIEVRFAAGAIVEARAKTGQNILERMIGTDDGARRLGEVALVPHSSPIAQSGILFYNTLFDENAASHIALGQAYSTCLIGGETMDAAALAARGANDSLIHVDWMIGSGEMNVDGVMADGTREPLMRRGEWV